MKNIEENSESDDHSDVEMDENSDNSGLNEEMQNSEPEPTVSRPLMKRKKKGIIYISTIPKHMNVTMIREIFDQYGKVGRVFLQPAKVSGDNNKKHKKQKKKFSRHFTEGWVEFESKRVAKFVSANLNNKQISTRKRSRFFDDCWNLKYLPRFKWIHLSERLSYEKAVFRQRLQTEVSQARKEAAFFQNNLDKSEKFKKLNKKENKKLNV